MLFQKKESVFFTVYVSAGQNELGQPKQNLPLIGWNKRNTHTRHLKQYFSGKHLTTIPYDRLSYLLKYLFVKAFFRYKIGIKYADFVKMVIIHEALHYKYITLDQPKDSNNVVQLLAKFVEDGTVGNETQYHSNLIYLLRSILEKSLEVTDRIETEYKTGKISKEAEQMFLLTEQLKTLLIETQEYIVDNQTMEIVFGKEKLGPIDYASPKEMILNRNEVLIFKDK